MKEQASCDQVSELGKGTRKKKKKKSLRPAVTATQQNTAEILEAFTSPVATDVPQ